MGLEKPYRARDESFKGADMALEPERRPPSMPATESGSGDSQFPGKLRQGQPFIFPKFPDMLSEG